MKITFKIKQTYK